MSSILSPLGLTIGQQFQLDPSKDWNFKFPPGKRHTALVGLAIDRKIRHLLSLKRDLDIMEPLNEFAPYDLFFAGLHIDIKSFSKKTISISENELQFAHEQWVKGRDLAYAMFEQLEGSQQFEERFVFHGFVLSSRLKTSGELRPSSIDSGAFFFVQNAKHLAFD